MDSGACDNVIYPDGLPYDCVIIPNTTGKHFRGANDGVIENYGDVETILGSDVGAVVWMGRGRGLKAAPLIHKSIDHRSSRRCSATRRYS